MTFMALIKFSFLIFSGGKSLTLSFAVRHNTPFCMHSSKISFAGLVVFIPIISPNPDILSTPFAPLFEPFLVLLVKILHPYAILR